MTNQTTQSPQQFQQLLNQLKNQAQTQQQQTDGQVNQAIQQAITCSFSGSTEYSGQSSILSNEPAVRSINKTAQATIKSTNSVKFTTS
jgi:hypothetical protein